MIYLMSEPELDPSPPTTTLALPSPLIHLRNLLYTIHSGTKVDRTELRFSRNWCLVDTHTGSEDMSSWVRRFGVRLTFESRLHYLPVM